MRRELGFSLHLSEFTTPRGDANPSSLLSYGSLKHDLDAELSTSAWRSYAWESNFASELAAMTRKPSGHHQFMDQFIGDTLRAGERKRAA